MSFFNLYQAPQVLSRRKVGSLQVFIANDRQKPIEAAQEPKKAGKRMAGTVKWYSHVIFYGFIESPGHPDVFIHGYDLQDSGLEKLIKGQRVSFTVVEKDGKFRALDVILS